MVRKKAVRHLDYFCYLPVYMQQYKNNKNRLFKRVININKTP